MDSVAVSIRTSALRQRVVNALAVTGLEVSAVTGPGTADAPVAIVESCELLAWQTSASRHAELIAVVHGEQDPVLGSAADLTEVVGIVDRDDMDEVLATAVHQVLDGHGWISPGLARRVLGDVLQPLGGVVDVLGADDRREPVPHRPVQLSRAGSAGS